MDPELRNKSLAAFSFGRKAAIGDITDPEVIALVAATAYDDVKRTLRGIAQHPAAGRLKRQTRQSIAEFVGELTGREDAEQFDRLHDDWCVEAMARFAKSPHPNGRFVFHYGQSQKWLNMTLKYLSILNHPAVAQVYPLLHVPLDDDVLAQAGAMGVPRPEKTYWSKLSREQYRTYQNALREHIWDTWGRDMAPLDWEASVWLYRAPLPEERPR